MRGARPAGCVGQASDWPTQRGCRVARAFWPGTNSAPCGARGVRCLREACRVSLLGRRTQRPPTRRLRGTTDSILARKQSRRVTLFFPAYCERVKPGWNSSPRGCTAPQCALIVLRYFCGGMNRRFPKQTLAAVPRAWRPHRTPSVSGHGKPPSRVPGGAALLSGIPRAVLRGASTRPSLILAAGGSPPTRAKIGSK